MKERPILFNGQMVRAVLEGRKTQTRRVIKHEGKIAVIQQSCGPMVLERYDAATESGFTLPCPYGHVGDRLWVREAHRLVNCECPETCRQPGMVWYEADQSGYENASLNKLRPSIHMPRWASRITLEITSVRVERLQDINEEDAIAEGIERHYSEPYPEKIWWKSSNDRDIAYGNPRPAFGFLWDSINGKGDFRWDKNPYVWVITFKRI
jgi:hypothetical protein